MTTPRSLSIPEMDVCHRFAKALRLRRCPGPARNRTRSSLHPHDCRCDSERTPTTAPPSRTGGEDMPQEQIGSKLIVGGAEVRARAINER
jgi:hypothetical protein